jgi:protein O-mannosyl-transferase
LRRTAGGRKAVLGVHKTKPEADNVKRDLVVLALLALVIFVIYGRSVDYPFEFDDTHVIQTNYKIQDPSYIPKFYYERGMFPEEDKLGATYRPLLFTTYALNYMTSGLNPRSYRLTNLFIHLLCAFFVYLIACSLLTEPPPGSDTPAWPYALGAALLFAVHPLQTETVEYIAARSSSLTAAACLMSLWLFIKYHETRRPAWLAGTILAYFAALLSKATAAPFILVFPLVARALERRKVPARPVSLWVYGSLAAGAVVTTIHRLSLAKSYSASHPAVRSLTEQWMSGLAALAKYARLLVYPSGLSVEHGFGTITGAADIRFLFGAAIAAAAIAAFLYYYNRRPSVSALIAWPFLALSPELMMRVKDIVVEYRMYLPLAGIVILAAYAARRLPVLARGRAVAAAVTCMLALTLALSALSYGRVQVWRSPVALWSDVVSQYPDNVRARNNLGMAMGMSGDYTGAMKQLQAAVQLNPTDFEVIINLGNVYAETGRFEKSIEVYKTALSIKPTDYSVNYNLALSYLDTGDFDSAYSIYARMLKLFPDNTELPRTAADALSSHGRPDLAARLIREYSSPSAR